MSVVARPVEVAAPDEPQGGDRLGRVDELDGPRRGGDEALADVVDRPAAQAARPAQRAQGEPLDARPGAGRQRLLRPRLDLADPLDALGGRAERHRGQGVRVQRGIRAGLRQRMLEVRAAVVVGHGSGAVREQEPRADARAAGRQRRELGREQVRHPPPLARGLELVGEREQPLDALRPVRRRQPQRLPGELDGLGRGAARRRAVRGGGHGVREPGVRLPRRQRQVARAPLVSGHGVRERAVQLAVLARPRVLAGRRAEQRVRRADAAGLGAQQAGVDGVLGVGHRRELVRVQLAAQGDREQGAPLRVGQCRHADVEHVLDRVRQRDLPAGRSPLGERAPDLEREQRVAERRVGDPAHQRSRHGEPQPLGQQAARVAEPERADLQALERPLLEHPLERGPAPGPAREQERDGLVRQPRRGERQGLGGRRVEPLEVVDRHQQRGEPAQLVEHAQRDGLLGRLARRGPQQRRLQRGPLRARQAGHVDPVEEVDQPRERMARLGPARPRHGDAQPERAGLVDPRLPQRRLPDPGRAREHERPRGPVEERSEPRELGLAADEPRVIEHERSFTHDER